MQYQQQFWNKRYQCQWTFIKLFKLVIKGIFPLGRLLQKLSAVLYLLTHKFLINLLALASLGFFCAVQGDQDKQACNIAGSLHEPFFGIYIEKVKCY